MKRLQHGINLTLLTACHALNRLAKILVILFSISFIMVGCENTEQSPSKPANNLSLEERLKKAEEEEMKKIPDFDHSDSLEGPDVNNDGVRDDIEAYIDGLGLPTRKKNALRQLAKSFRKTLMIDLENEEELSASLRQTIVATDCLYDAFPEEDGVQKAYDFGQILQAANANTKTRTQKYIEYNLKLSGRVFSSVKGYTCDE